MAENPVIIRGIGLKSYTRRQLPLRPSLHPCFKKLLPQLRITTKKVKNECLIHSPGPRPLPHHQPQRKTPRCSGEQSGPSSQGLRIKLNFLPQLGRWQEEEWLPSPSHSRRLGLRSISWCLLHTLIVLSKYEWRQVWDSILVLNVFPFYPRPHNGEEVSSQPRLPASLRWLTSWRRIQWECVNVRSNVPGCGLTLYLSKQSI